MPYSKTTDVLYGIKVAVYSVLLLWILFFLDVVLPFVDHRDMAIRARTLSGLRGIILSPLLHNGFSHLAANTGALLLLVMLAVAYNRRLAFSAVLIIWLFSGGIVWALGDNDSIYIGASGIIFGLIGLLITLGIARREWPELMISLLVFAVYGGAVASLFQHTPGVSWLSHASGFVCGSAVAWKTRHRPVQGTFL